MRIMSRQSHKECWITKNMREWRRSIEIVLEDQQNPKALRKRWGRSHQGRGTEICSTRSWMWCKRVICRRRSWLKLLMRQFLECWARRICTASVPWTYMRLLWDSKLSAIRICKSIILRCLLRTCPRMALWHMREVVTARVKGNKLGRKSSQIRLTWLIRANSIVQWGKENQLNTKVALKMKVANSWMELAQWTRSWSLMEECSNRWAVRRKTCSLLIKREVTKNRPQLTCYILRIMAQIRIWWSLETSIRWKQ